MPEDYRKIAIELLAYDVIKSDGVDAWPEFYEAVKEMPYAGPFYENRELRIIDSPQKPEDNVRYWGIVDDVVQWTLSIPMEILEEIKMELAAIFEEIGLVEWNSDEPEKTAQEESYTISNFSPGAEYYRKKGKEIPSLAGVQAHLPTKYLEKIDVFLQGARDTEKLTDHRSALEVINSFLETQSGGDRVIAAGPNDRKETRNTKA